jgi:hypothetical protein
VDLAFETDLIYLKVTDADSANHRVGIKTNDPTHTLTVNGTSRTTNLLVDTLADIADISISGTTISTTEDTLQLIPGGTSPVVYQAKLRVDDIEINNNVISSITADTDIELRPNGTGSVEVFSDVTVNGNIFATGDITVNGASITLGDEDTDSITFFADVASNIVPDLDNTYTLGTADKRWADAWVNTVYASTIDTGDIVVDNINLNLRQGKIYYVATNGSDAYSGTHQNDPYASIKFALSQAVSGDTVYIYPGTYTEIFPLTIPVGVSVKGSGIRSVTIQPTAGTIDKDAMLLSGETTVEDLTITGFRFNSIDNTGYAFRFINNLLVTTRSPYIKNITVITRGSVTDPATDPYGFDSNDAGKGALIDGSVANALSKEASMLFHSATFFTPNQETIVATNGVRIEWLNSFTYFADKGIYAYSSSTGFAGAGVTKLRINNRVGTWAVGNTVSYYDTDGTTVLASGTIASVDGDYVNLTGRQLGFETITDRAGKIVFANGDAKLSTAEKKFGTASLAIDGVGDYANIASQPDFAYGTDDFTIEFWMYRVGSGVSQFLIEQRTSASAQVVPYIFLNASNEIQYNSNAVNRIAGGVIPQNTWTHIALSRSGTDTKLFVNGTQTGATFTGDTQNYIQSPLRIGARWDGGVGLNGYIDEVRITKGIARYTANFTAPTSAFTGDLATVLLLHFDGANNSITILDDGITRQDIRTNAGGTASIIDFADYSDFGAEIRSIGSAAVYGNYGVYGDGPGVIAYLISQNFAYIGSGKLSTNDPNDRIAANEAVELNDAKIYYTSVDNEGNFKVGDFFYVNQQTGEVLFNGESLSVTTVSGVVFDDGTNITTVLPGEITTGNIRISDNTIESLSGDINITAASNEINLQNDTYITGNLEVTGDVNIGGNITIGDASTDTISFIAGITSNLTPATTETYDLGTDLLRWNNAYLSRAEIDGLVIDNNTIATTLGNDNLILTANGAGIIYIPNNDVEIDQNLTVTQDLTVTTGTTYLQSVEVTGTITQTGDIDQTGNFTTTGDIEVTGNILATGYLQLNEILVSNNVISTRVSGTDLELRANGTGDVVFEGLKVTDNNVQSTALNANITLTPQGSGNVVINSNQSIVIPVGTTEDQPAVPENGMIRYNTSTSRYEGYSGTNWTKLGGIESVDGRTRILPEASPGLGDNKLYFYANDVLTATIDDEKLYTIDFQTSNLDITGNSITSLGTNTDINLIPSGSGAVVFGDLRFSGGTISNTVSNSVTEITQSGTGYVKVAGSYGVVIPSGTNLTRPNLAFTELGMIRFNTENQFVEVFNGVSWSSVAGTSSGVTFNDATDIGIAISLTVG